MINAHSGSWHEVLRSRLLTTEPLTNPPSGCWAVIVSFLAIGIQTLATAGSGNCVLPGQSVRALVIGYYGTSSYHLANFVVWHPRNQNHPKHGRAITATNWKDAGSAIP